MENTNAFGVSAQRRRLSFFESSAHDFWLFDRSFFFTQWIMSTKPDSRALTISSSRQYHQGALADPEAGIQHNRTVGWQSGCTSSNIRVILLYGPGKVKDRNSLDSNDIISISESRFGSGSATS